MTGHDPSPADDDSEPCELGWALGMLIRDYRAHVETQLGDMPRGSRGYQLLYTVVRKKIRTQLELADYLGIDRSVMPYVVDDLVEAGLVDRITDPKDRRVRTVIPTDLGLRTLQRLQDRVSGAESTFLEALSAREQADFRELVARVAQQSRVHVRGLGADT